MLTKKIFFGLCFAVITQVAVDAQSVTNNHPHKMLKVTRAESPVVPTSASSKTDSILFVKYKTDAKAIVRGESGTLTFPIPGLYREQIPLTLRIWTEPNSALVEYRISKRLDGINWIAQVVVKPPPAGCVVHWESMVLVDGSERQILPKSKFPVEVPFSVKDWTRSSVCVQSNQAVIMEKANEIGKGTDDIETFARRVISFTSSNKGNGAPFNSLDALSAMNCGGSCTSRANLAAALLRAHGIPARTLSHMPTWYKHPMYEHWLVEYWHPGSGWVWLESTIRQMQPNPETVVVLAVSNIYDEAKATDFVHLRGIMPGAAYLSGSEFSRELKPASLIDRQTNTVESVYKFENSQNIVKALKEVARENFLRVIKNDNGKSDLHADRINAAARGGDLSGLLAALRSNLP
jgi:hypothetical protein